jgi:hypothetical protein
MAALSASARPALATRRGPAPPRAYSFAAANGGGPAGASPYTDELRATAKYIAQRGKGMCV